MTLHELPTSSAPSSARSPERASGPRRSPELPPDPRFGRLPGRRLWLWLVGLPRAGRDGGAGSGGSETRKAFLPGRALFRTLITASLLALAFWLIGRLLMGFGWKDVLARVEGARGSWLMLAALLKVGMLVAWGHRWSLAVRTLPGAPRRRVVYAAQVAGLTANLIAPFVKVLGSVVRVRYLKVFSGLSMGRSLGTVLFDQVAHAIVMVGMTLTMVVAAGALLGRPALAVGGAMVLMAAGALATHRRLTGRSAITEAIATFLAERAEARGDERRLLAEGGVAAATVADLVRRERLWWEVLGWSFVLFLLNVLSQWAAFRALGQDVPGTVVLIGVALGAAAGMLVGTPGGVGSTEAAMIGLYVAFGVDELTAAAGTLLFRLIHYGALVGMGLPALATLEIRHLVRRRDAAETPGAGDEAEVEQAA